MPRSSADTMRAGRVALVGRPNVGKSTLLNALLGERIAITSHHPQTTRGSVRGVLTRSDVQYVFVDTPGLHEPRTQLGRRMNEAARRAMKEADVVVLIVEAPREPRMSPAEDADAAILAELPTLPTILAVNKIDRLKDKSVLLPLITSLTESHEFVATVPISARLADGGERLLEEIRSVLPKQPLLFEPDTLSDQPVRFFVAEFVREQILRHTRQEVPHGVAVAVLRFEEGGRIPLIEVGVYVAREAHRKILIGAKGQMIKRIGTAARAPIERMLSRKVRLELRVHHDPGWMDDAARLSQLGLGEGPDAP
jgi:GTP-binding protein Era